MKVFVLTGAGISAESGIKTFRDSDGLWENHRLEDVATPEAFARDPHTVHRFYNARRQQLPNVKPNRAHISLAELEEQLGESFLLVTQNVDDLHERAGSKRLIHMHGELLRARCTTCNAVIPWSTDLDISSSCPVCDSNSLRPHIVWFGEIPLQMDQIQSFLMNCDVFVSIGTSGQVYPAAGFVAEAKSVGAHCVEINPNKSEISDFFDEHWIGTAGEMVPQWIQALKKRL